MEEREHQRFRQCGRVCHNFIVGSEKLSPSIVVMSFQIKNDGNMCLDVCNNKCFVDWKGGARHFCVTRRMKIESD